MLELEQQVAELTMQTEYQLRLKDLHVQVIEAIADELWALVLMLRGPALMLTGPELAPGGTSLGGDSHSSPLLLDV